MASAINLRPCMYFNCESFFMHMIKEMSSFSRVKLHKSFIKLPSTIMKIKLGHMVYDTIFDYLMLIKYMELTRKVELDIYVTSSVQ